MAAYTDFATALTEYEAAQREARGRGANFVIGMARRFVKWANDNDLPGPDAMPEDPLQAWYDLVIASGRREQSAARERELLVPFWHFCEIGTLPEPEEETTTVEQPTPTEPEVLSPSDPTPFEGGLADFPDHPTDDPVAVYHQPAETPAATPTGPVALKPPAPPPPAPPAPLKPPKAPPKPQAPKAPPRDALSGVLPSAGRIRVYRRSSLGALAPIGEYNADDVSGEGPIGFFLKRFVEPVYGPGTYEVRRIGANSQDLQPGWKIELLTPLGQPGHTASPMLGYHPPGEAGPTPIAQLKELLELVDTLQRKNVAVPPELLKKIDDLSTLVRPEQRAAASMHPSEMVNQLLQVHYTDQVMEAIRSRRQSATDPVVADRLSKVERYFEDQQRGAMNAGPPLPPPPPPVDVAGVVQAVAGAVRSQMPPPMALPDPYEGVAKVMEMASALNQGPPPPDPVQQFAGMVTALSPLLRPQGEDRMAMLERKLDQFMTSGGMGQTGLSKSVEDFAAVLGLVQKVTGGGPLGQAATGAVQLARDVIMNAPQVADAATRVILAARGIGAARAGATQPAAAAGTNGTPARIPRDAEVALRKLGSTNDSAEITALTFEAVRAFALDPEWAPKLAPAVSRLQGGDAGGVRAFVKNLLGSAEMPDLASEELLDKVTNSLVEILPSVTGASA